MSVLGNLVLKFNKQNLNEIDEKDDNSSRLSYQKHKKDYYLSNASLSRGLSGCSAKLKTAFEDLFQLSKVERFNENQDFKKIQKTYNRNNLFVDNTFPPTNQSVFYSDSFKQSLKLDGKLEAYTNKVIWKRAKDICRDAHFSIDNDGHSSEDSIINELNYKKFFATTDLDQGLVGNCWFISGATGVLQNYNLFKRVIPLDNTFNETEYTGAFHFRFWQYGMWKDVVIDDYLPVDRYGQLLFCKNRDTPNEFWSSLLEKAYAKICGSYEALEGGFTSEALIDMSGGIEEVYNLNEICKDKSSKQPSSDKFWDILLSAKKKCSVIGCNIESKAESGIGKEYRMENGLVQGHAYVVTNLANVRLSTNKYVRLIRIYNPWGKVEFCGDYSDKSSKWSLVDSETKEKLEIKIDDDGEFWMSYEDWLNNFDHCQICNLTPEICCDVIDSEYETQKLMSSLVSMWQPQYFHGEWLINESAGGRGELNPAKYWTNPQYSFIINDIDLVDDDSCWIIISLMQKHTRKKRNSNNSNKNSEEYIQYRLFKAKSIDIFNEQLNYNKPMLHNQLEKIGSSGPYINKREVTKRFKLKTGAYIIVPSTYDEDIEGEFLLRIFTEKPLVKRSFRTSKRRLTVFNNDGLDPVNSIAQKLFQIQDDCLKKEKKLSNFVSDILINSASNSGKDNHNHRVHDSHRPSIACNQM